MKPILVSVASVAASVVLLGGVDPSENFVAHEWGTFTSVQGADGVPLEWNPLETTKLPKFVYDWSKPGLGRLGAGPLNPLLKSRFITLQRMETPVIYFYSDRDRTVDVTVRFPQGLITEWYPQAQDIGPSVFPPNRLATTLDDLVRDAGLPPRINFASLLGKKGIADSRVQWKQLRVLAPGKQAEAAGAIPTEAPGNHYFAARATDAAIVRVNPLERARSAEHEKFLFYRGVANFKTPLRATMRGADEEFLGLHNDGATELRHLYVLRVHDGKAGFTYIRDLDRNGNESVELTGIRTDLPLKQVITEISRSLADALTKEGLYPREAAAMVKTWRESWFEEEGLRVLYVLPRAWTDEILPLTIEPKPREIVRVMVGRAEIITPSVEWELLKQIVRFSEQDAAGRQEAVANVQAMGLGRFADVALRRVLGSAPSRAFRDTASQLVNAALKQSDTGRLAAK